MQAKRVFGGAFLVGCATVFVAGCGAESAPDDTSQSEGAIAIPAEELGAATDACKTQGAIVLKYWTDQGNTTIQGPYETCANGARVACDKAMSPMAGSYRRCGECTQRTRAQVTCTPAAAGATTSGESGTSADTACAQAVLTSPTQLAPYYEPGEDAYINPLKFEIRNPSGAPLKGAKLVYKHVFPCSGALPDQVYDVDEIAAGGTYPVQFDVTYKEAKFGPEFGVNRFTLEVRCGSRTVAKSGSFTRRGSAGDAASVCKNAAKVECCWDPNSLMSAPAGG